MKKYWMMAALGMALMLTAPAWAIQADFSGEYRVSGIYNDHLTLIDDDSSSDAFMEMRLRLRADFTITDNLSLTTRLDGLDKRWGDTDESKVTSRSTQNLGTPSTTYPLISTITTVEDDQDNIDLEWVYMTVKTGLGGFLVGRQRGNVWGLNFAETEDPRDRVVYVLPIKNTIIAAVYEKSREFDGENTTTSDADIDRYYLTVTQKGENFKAGLLYGLYNFKTFQDMWQSQQSQLLTNFSAINGSSLGPTPDFLLSDVTANVFIPYFDGKFGPFGVKAELSWAFGDINYDSPYRVTPTNAQVNAATIPFGIENADGDDSKDGDVMSYLLELSYDVGPFTFQAGYAHYSGDADYNDDEVGAFGYIERGEDWEKLAILTGTHHGLETSLGNGLGNLAGGGKATLDGYNMFYAGVDFAVLDNLTVGLLYGKSTADDTTEEDPNRSIAYAQYNAAFGASFSNADWDDDHGQEVDLTVTWQIFPNLKYQFIAAYLDAGDYWKQGDDSVDLKDNYLLWHRLTVEF